MMAWPLRLATTPLRTPDDVAKCSPHLLIVAAADSKKTWQVVGQPIKHAAVQPMH
jgi:hypothetical protein